MGERLLGKIAIITGSGRGIGRACAARFAREGAAVVVTDIDAGNAADTTQSIVAAGGRAISHPADVTDSSQVDGLVDRAVSEFGRLDIMFNNAGGALPRMTSLNQHQVERSCDGRVRVLPSAQIHHSHFADFQRDPLGVVSGLYEHFGIPWTPEAEASLSQAHDDHPAGRHGTHAYSRGLLGAAPETLRKAFARYQDRFGVGSEG